MVFGERGERRTIFAHCPAGGGGGGGGGANANMMGMGVVAFERLYRASEGGREGRVLEGGSSWVAWRG